MVELENSSQQFLTFRRGDKTVRVQAVDNYSTKDVVSTFAQLGLKRQASKIYPIIREFAPNSKTSASEGGRVQHKLNQVEFETIVNQTIQKHESSDVENVRFYAIDIENETIIELRDITDFKWERYEPLLDVLRTTRTQTESGEVQTTPITHEKVRDFFPENVLNSTIYSAFLDLNTALSPSGWSVEHKSEGHKKPINAWYLRGPDDNDVQNKRQPTDANLRDTYNRTVSAQIRESAEKRFDRIDFGTNLLHSSLSHLIHPDAKETFEKNLEQFMSSFLPPDLKLHDILGEKTPQEYFADSINVAEHNASKKYEQLSVKQKAIVDLWFLLELESGNDPKSIIFEHFSQPESNNIPLDQENNDNGNSEEVIVKPKPIREREKNIEIIPNPQKQEVTSVVLDADGNRVYGLYKTERQILTLLINASKVGPISRTNFIELCNKNGLTKLNVTLFLRYYSTIKDRLLDSLYYIDISPHIDPLTNKESSPKESDYRFTKKLPITSAPAL